MVPLKSIRISDEQKEKLLDFMNNHPDFAAGRFSGPLGRQKKIEMWDRLAIILNADGAGAEETGEKWNKSWDDWKSNTRAKASELLAHANGTGGGRANPSKLPDMELRLLEFVGFHTAFGDKSQEAGFTPKLGYNVVSDGMVDVVEKLANQPTKHFTTTKPLIKKFLSPLQFQPLSPSQWNQTPSPSLPSVITTSAIPGPSTIDDNPPAYVNEVQILNDGGIGKRVPKVCDTPGMHTSKLGPKPPKGSGSGTLASMAMF